MLRTNTALVSLFVLGLAACSPSTQQPVTDTAASATEAGPSQAEREAETERLNAWFEQKFAEAISRSPMSATFLGSRENYDKWNDVSYAAQDAEMEIQRANVAEMREQFDPAALTGQGALSYRLAVYELESAERADKWRKVTSKSDAEAYIARLAGVETYLGQHLANAQASAERGIRPPLFVYDFVIDGAANVIDGYPFEGVDPDTPSPLYADFVGKVDALVTNDTITEDEASELKLNARGALIDHVYPTYSALIQWVYDDKANASPEDGAWKHPKGDAYYTDRLAQMTTTDMTPDEIHDLGLAEVARIHGEMEAIMQQVGFEGSLQDFFEFTRTDGQFFKPNTEQGKGEYLSEAISESGSCRQSG